jgi:hypothetical protein
MPARRANQNLWAWPSLAPIACDDLALDGLTAFLRLALRALALAGLPLGENALAFDTMRLVA